MLAAIAMAELLFAIRAVVTDNISAWWITNATKSAIPGKVSAIEYDPNRTARLALIVYADGEKRYIVAPLGLKVGDAIFSGPQAEIRTGNSLPICQHPGWYPGPQYRAQTGKRRPIGPFCRFSCSVAGQRR